MYAAWWKSFIVSSLASIWVTFSMWFVTRGNTRMKNSLWQSWCINGESTCMHEVLTNDAMTSNVVHLSGLFKLASQFSSPSCSTYPLSSQQMQRVWKWVHFIKICMVISLMICIDHYHESWTWQRYCFHEKFCQPNGRKVWDYIWFVVIILMEQIYLQCL